MMTCLSSYLEIYFLNYDDNFLFNSKKERAIPLISDWGSSPNISNFMFILLMNILFMFLFFEILKINISIFLLTMVHILLIYKKFETKKE